MRESDWIRPVAIWTVVAVLSLIPSPGMCQQDPPTRCQLGKCLNCYQCNSTLENNCNEKFVLTKLNPLKSIACNVDDARYCIKVTGLWGGVVGTHRFCSSRDMGHQCQDIWYPDHDRLYRACIYTCSQDGCNAADRVNIHLFLSLILAASLKFL